MKSLPSLDQLTGVRAGPPVPRQSPEQQVSILRQWQAALAPRL